MTESEAIEIVRKEKAYMDSHAGRAQSEAFQIAINALEKQIPKKPMFNGKNWYRCVNGCEIHKKQFEKDWYCPKCGQKLNWEGDEE